ncbi:hypothetical protein SCLCIDRAFT_1222488 [Scleroderma citrinum Foug A]|uniref:Uncharacterized protein n=1 Tax=Scleroderma citrinum Foug A TaxID=1036808 RepID=A0A0C3DCN2_9AGAM|nr:hypothetical protein SCLCIDRAFT_1222488 [Scleroderma citrinum Foug A]
MLYRTKQSYTRAYLNTYEEGPRSAHIRIARSGSIEPDAIIFWLGCVYQHNVNFGKVKQQTMHHLL